MAQQIAKSNINNKSRLRILNARQQVLDSVFQDARTNLPEIQKDQQKYRNLLKNLILEVKKSFPCLELMMMAGNVCFDGEGIVYTSTQSGC